MGAGLLGVRRAVVRAVAGVVRTVAGVVTCLVAGVVTCLVVGSVMHLGGVVARRVISTVPGQGAGRHGERGGGGEGDQGLGES